MILLDKTPSRHAAEELMPSIDADVVQQMFGDDLALFNSLLARILREYADLALPVRVSSDDEGSRTQLRARAHKLKGSAAMIGATAIMRLAGATEAAIQESRPVAIVEELLGQLATALTTLREEAEVLRQAQPARDADNGAKATHGPNIGATDIDELCALLESQNLAAIDKFSLFSPSLSELVGTVRFDRLRDAIDNLDFQLGAELLRQAVLPKNADVPGVKH